MSPYRILTRFGNDYTVLAAMLSVDKQTNTRRIFIVEKELPWLFELDQDVITSYAHRMTTRKNSYIITSYHICREADGYKYIVYDKHDRPLQGKYYKQSDCLVAAMRNYQEMHKIENVWII